jgi:arylformamidase
VFVDLTMRIAADMPFNPDHFPPEITPYATIETHGWSASRLVLDSHLGTHIDAPCHFLEGGTTVDQIPLDVLIGPAQVVRLDAIEPGQPITPELLPPLEQPRVLIQTGWARDFIGSRDYFSTYPYLTPNTAVSLAEQGVKLVGLDGPSVDYDPGDTHIALLQHGIIIIENLMNLDQLPTQCTLIALPLHIRGGDGSPARVVAQV